MVFLQISLIWDCFGAPILRPFGTIRCKKRSSEKKMQKQLKNKSAAPTRKTDPGAAGPLKQDSQTALGSETLDRTRHECLAARWRISFKEFREFCIFSMKFIFSLLF